MQTLVHRLKALSEPTRLRIVALLAEAELTLTTLCEILGQSQPRVSRHLKILVDAQLVERMAEGVHAYFSLNQQNEQRQLTRIVTSFLPAEDALLIRDRQRLAAFHARQNEEAHLWLERNVAQEEILRKMQASQEAVEAALLQLLPDDLSHHAVLDIGTGTGRMIELLAAKVGHILGIDISRDMLQIARVRLQQMHREGQSHVRMADILMLPFSEPSFDTAVMHHTLHAVARPGEAISVAAQVLKADGSLWIIDYARHQHHDRLKAIGHVWPGFTHEEISEWGAMAGLDVVCHRTLHGAELDTAIWECRKSNQATTHKQGARHANYFHG